MFVLNKNYVYIYVYDCFFNKIYICICNNKFQMSIYFLSIRWHHRIFESALVLGVLVCVCVCVTSGAEQSCMECTWAFNRITYIYIFCNVIILWFILLSHTHTNWINKDVFIECWQNNCCNRVCQTDRAHYPWYW